MSDPRMATGPHDLSEATPLEAPEADAAEQATPARPEPGLDPEASARTPTPDEPLDEVAHEADAADVVEQRRDAVDAPDDDETPEPDNDAR